jgi:hypothetical protein
MKTVKHCMPQIRYLFFYIKKIKRSGYVKYANSDLVTCLWQIGLNLMFSHKNGIKLTKSQINLMHRYKKGLKQLLNAKSIEERKKCLTNDILDILLSIFIPWISKTGLEN